MSAAASQNPTNLPATTPSQTQAVAKLLAKADESDSAASAALELLDVEGGLFKKMISTSRAFKIIKAELTDDIVTEIMSLMNTSLGFRTDKDPNQVDKQGKAHVPYSIAVVRDVLVEAALKKARWWGNEFNIIAGKLYLTKEFYERMVRTFPGVTDVDNRPGVPTMIGEDGALVPYFLTWKLNGKEMRVERKKVGDSEDTRFVIRRNANMGVDAVLGKAAKRAWAAAFGKLIGKEEDHEDDVIDVSPGPTSLPPSGQAPQGSTSPDAPENGSGAGSKQAAQSTAAGAAQSMFSK